MSAENEKSYRGAVMIIVAVVLGGVFLYWNQGGDGAPITTSRSASSVPQAETRQSLDAMAESYFSGGHYDAAIGVYHLRGQNLVQPMLSGDKPLPPDVPPSTDSALTRGIALALVLAVGAVAVWIGRQAG